MNYLLLEAFREVFAGHPYKHRDSSIGDRVALALLEDLARIGKSKVLAARLAVDEVVVNVRNLRVGVKARRGDGTLGERVPGSKIVRDPGVVIPRGHVATVEIGVEVKILAKAMIKQIDRVMRDLKGQVDEFRKKGGKPISIGIVGINWASRYLSFERDRQFETGSRDRAPHPVKEARRAESRLLAEASPRFDEFLILRYRATNFEPFEFLWVDADRTEMEYGALLTRVARKYDDYFG